MKNEKQHDTAVSEGLTPVQYMDTIRVSPIYGGMQCRRKLDWLYQEAASMGVTLPVGVSVYEGDNLARLYRGEKTQPDFRKNSSELKSIDYLAA